jgi:hypothetical protein
VDWIYLAYKMGEVAGSCILGHETASSKMRGLRLTEVLKENSAPWSWSNSNLVAVITFLLRSMNKGLPVDMAPWRCKHAKENEHDNLGARSRSEQRILKYEVNGRTDLIPILYSN